MKSMFCIRSRTATIAAIALLFLSHTEYVTGLAATTAATRQKKLGSKTKITPLSSPGSGTTKEFNEEYVDDSMQSLKEGMSAFKELRQATGPEILDNALQEQIDRSSKSPDMFLDTHVKDASTLEKIAMSTIPQQLPQPAVDAFRKTRRKQRRKTSPHKLNYSHERITPEQEIELAQIIQRGAALHKIKTDFEEKEGREIKKKEWSEYSGMPPKDIRRLVANYRKAKQMLVSANMGLVHSVVKKQYSRLSKSGVEFSEYVQEASLGLIRAAELFDPDQGVRFSTYATIWIKGTLGNTDVVGTIKLPLRERTKWNKIVKAHKELTEKNGEPTVEELAKYLKMKPEEVMLTRRKMRQTKNVLSLDYEYDTNTRSGTMSGNTKSLQDDKAFMQDADLAEKMQMQADIVAAMARNLDAREARLMRLRYGLVDGQSRSLRECAEAMGLGESSVQHLARKCLKKLRAADEAESLEEYLLTVC